MSASVFGSALKMTHLAALHAPFVTVVLLAIPGLLALIPT
jgi:hypothetical protein